MGSHISNGIAIDTIDTNQYLLAAFTDYRKVQHGLRTVWYLVAVVAVIFLGMFLLGRIGGQGNTGPAIVPGNQCAGIPSTVCPAGSPGGGCADPFASGACAPPNCSTVGLQSRPRRRRGNPLALANIQAKIGVPDTPESSESSKVTENPPPAGT